MRMRFWPVAAALAAVALVSACSGAATPTPQSDAEAAVCTALQTWSDEMRTLTNLDATTTSIDDAKAQAEKVSTAWGDVKTALAGVNAADKAAVEAGGDALVAAINAFPTDVPVAEAIAAVKTAAEPLKTAYTEMANGMGCKLATPY
jgi:hypothetical protein